MCKHVYVGHFGTGKSSRLLRIIRHSNADVIIVCDPAFLHESKSLGVASLKMFGKNAKLIRDPVEFHDCLIDSLESRNWPCCIVCDLSKFVELGHVHPDKEFGRQIRSLYKCDFYSILQQFFNILKDRRAKSLFLTDEVEWELRSVSLMKRLNLYGCKFFVAIHPPVYIKNRSLYSCFRKHFLNRVYEEIQKDV